MDQHIDVAGGGGVRLAVRSTLGPARGGGGAPEAVLLLHDLLGRGTQWAATARRLADRYRVVVPDLRGHGRSAAPADGRQDRAAHVEDVLAVVDRLGLTSVALVGHGLGAMTAWQVAARRPEAVTALVVCDMRAAAWGEAGREEWAAWRRSWPEPFRSPAEARRWFGVEDPALDAPAPARGAYFASALTRRAEGWVPALTARETLAARETWVHDAHWDELAEVDCPALVVRGPDGELGRAEAQEMVRVLPRGRYAEVAEGGHWLPWERPAEWRRVVRPFLDSAVPATCAAARAATRR